MLVTGVVLPDVPAVQSESWLSLANAGRLNLEYRPLRFLLLMEMIFSLFCELPLGVRAELDAAAAACFLVTGEDGKDIESSNSGTARKDAVKFSVLSGELTRELPQTWFSKNEARVELDKDEVSIPEVPPPPLMSIEGALLSVPLVRSQLEKSSAEYLRLRRGRDECAAVATELIVAIARAGTGTVLTGILLLPQDLLGTKLAPEPLLLLIVLFLVTMPILPDPDTQSLELKVPLLSMEFTVCLLLPDETLATLFLLLFKPKEFEPLGANSL